MRSVIPREEVFRLARCGLTDREVAAATGVPVSTVGRWCREAQLPRRPRAPRPTPPLDLEQIPPAPYAYLLGIYADAFDASAQAAVTVSNPTMRFMEGPSWS